MALSDSFTIEINKVNQSRLPETDIQNPVFGTVFSDHMLICEYKNGQWSNPKIQPYGNLSISPGARVFHYGQAIFEGMKAYRDAQGQVWLFRPEENFKRFNKSSVRMAMPEVPKEIFLDGLLELLRLDYDWVPSGYGNSLYIRPFIFGSQVGVSASPSEEYTFMILLCPVKTYYTEKIKVLISDYYSRAANGGVGAAKAAGNYGAQFYPTNLARQKGYHQVIWTDDCSHQFLEEAGTMNVFFRINDQLITAPVSDRILDGVTRKSIIDLAKHLNLDVEVRKITVDELLEAHQNKKLKEIFGVGTAALISAVAGFGYKDNHYELPDVEDSYSDLLKEKLMNIQWNIDEDPFGWRLKV